LDLGISDYVSIRPPSFIKLTHHSRFLTGLLDMKKTAGRGQDLLDVEKLRKLNLHRKKP
jgi:hypothetical protein